LSKDIFYRIIEPQPEPGNTNKSCLIETVVNDKAKTLIVPSTPALNFGPAMTAEAWVKIDPSTENKINILGKINGYDGDDLYPFFNEVSGYFMGFLKSGNKFAVHTRLVTDKGKFLNTGDYTVDDDLWHHIVITYDAGAGSNNFKTYFDGLLLKEQTVTGDIVQGDGLLMIGSRSNYYHTSKYEVDDIRLWDRALTQEELLFNQVNKLNGTEVGLKLFLNFDDTFKDISGNGHDALPVYQGILKNSDFDPPVPGFEMFRIASEVTFNNKTTNATEYTWNFGDGQLTEEANPKHTYSQPGEYSILLKARNANSITAAKGNVSIAGIDRIEPSTAGNLGRTTIRIYGGGLPDSPVLKLVKNGIEIVADTVITIHPGEIHGTFNLTEQPTGKWDVIVVMPSGNMELKESLTVEDVHFQNPYVNVSGRSTVLANMWHTQIIEIGNPGNIDLKNVPLFIAISNLPGIEYEFINFEVVMQQHAIENGLEYLKDSVPIHIIQENFFPELPGQATVRDAIIIPLVIGNLPAQTTFPLQIRLKSDGPFDLQAWTYGVTGSENLKSSGADTDCLYDAVMAGMANIWYDALGMGISALPMGCIKSVYELYGMHSYTMEGKEYTFTSLMWDLTSVAVNCAADLPPFKAVKITIQAVGITMSAAGMLKNIYDCFFPNSQIFKRIYTVFSFDPNEMVGPAGFGEQNWIQKSKTIPYTIFFENKSEATAPAHIVTISDTLDLSVFDISDFGFGPFGWGDTIFSPPGIKMKQFSMDIDLRPGLELITRVSGKLDTLTGIVKWEFLSLNPVTMNLEEDPFLGFLPPNVTSPEGEGFVSFSVGLKDELGTGDEIRNQASIVFDANEPIITNEYLNTLDMDAPQSQVYPLEATTDSRFPVNWTGSDKGSGIRYYTIYVMINDTALVSWLVNTPEVSAIFEGEVGSIYKFYSIATDNVSLVENAPNGYDAQTTVTVNVKEFERVKSGLAVWPNPATENLRVTLRNAPCGMYVVELVSATGAVKHSQLYEDTELHNGITINVADCTPGNYMLRMVFGNKTEARILVVQ
jgi:PKD repeat protein